MKNQLKYKSLYFVLLLTLVFSTLVFSRVESAATPSALLAENSQPKTDAIPANSKIFAPQNQLSQSKEVPPAKDTYNKKSKFSVARFLLAMLGVLLSSLAIFGGLRLYKFLVSKKGSTSFDKKNKNSLESPKTFKDAINSFLDKTDK